MECPTDQSSTKGQTARSAWITSARKPVPHTGVTRPLATTRRAECCPGSSAAWNRRLAARARPVQILGSTRSGLRHRRCAIGPHRRAVHGLGGRGPCQVRCRVLRRPVAHRRKCMAPLVHDQRPQAPARGFARGDDRGRRARTRDAYALALAAQRLRCPPFGRSHRSSGLLRPGSDTDGAGQAREIADRTGEANHMGTAFGPVNVALHAISVSLRLGDPRAATETGEALDTAAMPIGLVGRRTQVNLDLARAYGHVPEGCGRGQPAANCRTAQSPADSP